MAFSFVVAALFMAVPVIIQYRGELSLEFCLVSFSSIVFVLMFSLLFATIAQKRKAQVILDYTEYETKKVIENPKYFATKAQRLKYRVEYFGKIEKSLHDNNKSRVKYIQISMIFFYISLGLCALWFAIAVCILIFT